MAVDASDIVRLVVAGALTFALGFERDLRGAGAGERVFALIGIGAGAVGVLAAHGAPAALTGALTGVGFIGAGLVFRQEQPHIVRGLTTAASILAAVAIGATAGEGMLLVATAATALVLLVLEGRYVRVLRLLDSRRWANRFRQDEWSTPEPPRGAADDRGRRAGNSLLALRGSLQE
jgi:putative Mg2+ transporter-C (MgtC) family protein